MEYYGKCPACGSYDIKTIDTYEIPKSRETELHYVCKCNECEAIFDATDNDESC